MSSVHSVSKTRILLVVTGRVGDNDSAIRARVPVAARSLDYASGNTYSGLG